MMMLNLKRYLVCGSLTLLLSACGGAGSGGNGGTANNTNTTNVNPIVPANSETITTPVSGNAQPGTDIENTGTGGSSTSSSNTGPEEVPAIVSVGENGEQVAGFEDGFDTEFTNRDPDGVIRGSASSTNIKTLYKWDLMAGRIDLIYDNDGFNIDCPTGKGCLDMDGTYDSAHPGLKTNPASRLLSKPITINSPGTYTLKLSLTDNGRLLKPRRVSVSIDTYLEFEEVIQPGDGVVLVHKQFHVPDAGVEVKIDIVLLGEADGYGPILDDVSLVEGGYRP